MGEREGLNASLVQREVARRDGAPAKAQRKRVWWGEEVRRRERDLSRLSGARRGIHSPHRRDGGIDRFTSQSQACQPGFAPQGDFLSGQKVTKDPPKAGPSPALWNPPRGTGCACILLVSALGLERSHRWRGTSTERAYSSVWLFFDCQGLTLVSRCFQLTGAWLPVAGTPLLQGRPGGGNRPVIGPIAQDSLVWWHG